MGAGHWDEQMSTFFLSYVLLLRPTGAGDRRRSDLSIRRSVPSVGQVMRVGAARRLHRPEPLISRAPAPGAVGRSRPVYCSDTWPLQYQLSAISFELTTQMFNIHRMMTGYSKLLISVFSSSSSHLDSGHCPSGDQWYVSVQVPQVVDACRFSLYRLPLLLLLLTLHMLTRSSVHTDKLLVS
ncbi:unnamed protein product [Pleuronectes platessa]|uniref:Uncharacterized protein n=1 Tax=Pleuronectes platessa TaxID=8262 RepID=A0A9N7Z9X4_PLEPL|nr:unnamed protein product [Pleuronectes platessa]